MNELVDGVCATRKKMVKIQTICIWICYACCAMSGLVPQMTLSLITIFCVVIICCYGDPVAVWPIMIFYYSVFGTVLGISVYRIFSLLFLMVHCYKKKRLRIEYRVVPPLLVYIYYLVAVVFGHSVRTMLFSFVDIICSVLLVCDYLSNENELRAFFSSYVVVAFLSFITGLVSGNEMIVMQDYSGRILTISRFTATFEDPNYLGFFYTIAIFAIVSLKMYWPVLRVIVIIGLYGIILASMSMTAIIGNILLWMLFLLIRGKINIKIIGTVFLAVLAVIWVYNYGLVHPDLKLIGDMSLRVQDKLNSLFIKDFDAFSTGRTYLSEVHLDIFRNSSIIQQLIGGRAVNSYYIDVGRSANFSAHNEYVDMLLNVGIIGWIIMYGYIIISIIRKIHAFRSNGDNFSLCGIIMNLTWLYYVATLTVFLDFRYLFAYFI